MGVSPNKTELFIDGPTGRLEAILERPRDVLDPPCAVVCHPHPQHGGTMHNKVAYTLARAFLECGFAVMRFNFRGTENSEGRYDEGVGEVEDARAAIAWMRENFSSNTLWLGGFSFGAAVAIRASADSGLDGLVSIAPAVSRFAAGLESQPTCPWLVLIGDQDELVSVDEIVEWVDSLEPGPELLVMPDAEHFFHGRLVEMRKTIVEFVGRDQQA